MVSSAEQLQPLLVLQVPALRGGSVCPNRADKITPTHESINRVMSNGWVATIHNLQRCRAFGQVISWPGCWSVHVAPSSVQTPFGASRLGDRKDTQS